MFLIRLFRRILFGTYIRGFVFSYLLFMITGAILLSLPASLQPGVHIDMVDALFTSASALSTTGLTTVSPRDTFSLFGQTVLIMIIQIGGIGLIMLVALFWLVVGRKIGFKQRNMIMTDQNQLSRGGIVRFVRDVLIMIFIIQFTAFSVMTIHLVMRGTFPLNEALFQSFFLTISLFTNAGFDIAPVGVSFSMYATDYTMQSLAMFLMFLGAVGFWPLAEFKEFVVAKLHRETFTFSIFVKTLFFLHFGIWFFSAIMIFMIERNGFLVDRNVIETVYYSLFMALTTRNAGFSTMDVSLLRESSQLFIIILMFIGASPNSAGGGVRTSTVLVAGLLLYSYARGKDRVTYNRRFIKTETVDKAIIALLFATAIIMVNLFLLTLVEPHGIKNLSFELVSAFGTTGLSLGITDTLTTFGKSILIITMFIGRVGVIALLLMFRPSTKKVSAYEYPETDMIVG